MARTPNTKAGVFLSNSTVNSVAKGTKPQPNVNQSRKR